MTEVVTESLEDQAIAAWPVWEPSVYPSGFPFPTKDVLAVSVPETSWADENTREAAMRSLSGMAISKAWAPYYALSASTSGGEVTIELRPLMSPA